MHVNGGLANQLICYKAAVLLAKLNSATLVLDATAYERIKNQGRRYYQLHHHAIKPDLTIFSEAVMRRIRAGACKIRQIERDELPGASKEILNIFLLDETDAILDLDFWAALHLRSLAVL